MPGAPSNKRMPLTKLGAAPVLQEDDVAQGPGTRNADVHTKVVRLLPRVEALPAHGTTALEKGRRLEMSQLKEHLRYALPIGVVAALAGAAFGRVEARGSGLQVDEITVKRVRVLDSEGRERVTIAGDFSPRRTELAGLLFHNEDGGEAGGLVYHGRRGADGQIEAGGLLTFDQYRDDQIMALEYDHVGSQKRNGITISDRPDKMSDRVLAFYRAFEAAKSDEERERIKQEMLGKIPREEFVARRLYFGRNADGASLVSLCDASGRPRLNLEVDAAGRASIAFLDASGNVVRTIMP